METGEHITKEWLRNKKQELDNSNEEYPIIVDNEIGVCIIRNNDILPLLNEAKIVSNELNFTDRVNRFEFLLQHIKLNN